MDWKLYTIDKAAELDFLRKKAAEVRHIDQEFIDITRSMADFMVKSNGVGLAAPQVGKDWRLFVAKLPDEEPMVFINPVIIETSEKLSVWEEGCLSIPNMYEKVKRPAVVQVQAFNAKGRPFTIEASGFLSTIIQHELDHLNGILFIDHLQDKKKNKILKKFNIIP